MANVNVMVQRFWNVFPRIALPRRMSGIRMKSTIVGDSGRAYDIGSVLRRNPHDSKFDIFNAESENQSYILKHVPQRVFDLSRRIADDIPSCRWLRMHIDCNREESVLIYPFFRDTLLALLRDDPGFPPDERFKIMRSVGEAIAELHAHSWFMPPDNVLVDWTRNAAGDKVITNVALGDFDIACRLKEGESRLSPHALGNAMWRSPEGQTGISSRASDIYSLGLVYLYILGGGDILVLQDYQDLVKAGIPPEQEVVTKHFCYFGPVPEALFEEITDEDWKNAFRLASKLAEERVAEEPLLRMSAWCEQELGKEAVALFSGTTNLDPKARMAIGQLLDLPFWLQGTPL